jgi:hypothetical protein
MAEIRTHDNLIMSSTLYLLRYQCFVVKCSSLWYIYHVCPWTSGSLYVIKLTTNLPGLPYGYWNARNCYNVILSASTIKEVFQILGYHLKDPVERKRGSLGDRSLMQQFRKSKRNELLLYCYYYYRSTMGQSIT